MTSIDVFTAALDLPQDQRAKLVMALLRSLDAEDGLSDNERDAAWDKEVSRRLAAWRSGEAGSSPADEVIARARQHLASLK